MANFEPFIVLHCCLYHDRLFKHIVTGPSEINLLSDYVPQLLRKFIARAQHDFIDLHVL